MFRSLEEQVCYILAESHRDLGCLTVLDLCELGGEHKTMALKHEGVMKVPAKKRTAADKESWAAAQKPQKLVQWSDARWRDRLLQLFEFLVLSADPSVVHRVHAFFVLCFRPLTHSPVYFFSGSWLGSHGRQPWWASTRSPSSAEASFPGSRTS